MKISIIGCGYVGAVTGACFAELGNDVCFIDVDTQKIKKIDSHQSPIFEPGLDALLEHNAPHLSTSTSIIICKILEITNISCQTKYLLQVVRDLLVHI